MKKTLCIILMAAMVISIMAGLTACGSPGTPVNVVIVDGNARANSASFSYNLPAISNLLNRAAHNGFVGQVSVEGVPRETASYTISKPHKTGLTQTKLDDIARSNQATVTATLQSLEVTTGEADVLKALQMGARLVQANHQDSSEDYLIILDSMLPTEGVLDFTASNLLDADPEMIVEALRAYGEIPVLDGMSVIVFGCGDTVLPQQPLTSKARSNLKAIWTAILQAGNAKSIEFKDELPSDTELNSALPYVSTVAVVSDKIQFTDSDEVPTSDNTPTCEAEQEPEPEIVRLDDTTVSFVADEAVFIDPSAARDAVLPFATYLKEHPEQRILLAGSTATAGTREGCLRLSKERAQAIADILITEGVDEDQLAVIGLGQEMHALRIQDLNAVGALVETEAAKNRCVYLILLPADVADDLMKIGK